ncbi:MAG TPA: YbfB/YjiJ family MFS transporter [Candidatus Elarobacter sp.]|jgi:predicted MFS family arabinose efflux permease|nr:YbfB/YjiJ family MFS transporter [Candidatus Elarobacter sp.]
MTSPAERLGSLRPYLAGTVLFAVAMGVGRFAYTPLLVVMRSDAGLSVTLAGVLASANLAGYLAGALAATIPAIRRRRVTVVIASAAAVAVLTAAMAGPAWTWLPARTLTGICSGLVFVLAVGIVLDHATLHDSRWGAPMLFGGVGVGIAASGLLVPALASFAGSRGTWLALGALSGIAVACVAGWLPRDDASPRADARPAGGEHAGAAGPSPRFWALALVYGIEGGVYIIPATFLVALIAETPALAGFAPFTWVVVGLLAVPSAAVWGAVSRRIGVATALTLAFVAQALALLIPAVAGGILGALAVAIGIGGTFIAISSLAMSLGRTYWPARSNAAAGVLTALYGIGQIAGPLFATHVALRTGSYRAAFPLAAAALLVPTALYAISSTRWLEKTRNRVS